MRRYTQLGQELKAARLEKGWSQHRFAEMLGTQRQRFILWEQGKHRPNRRYRMMLEALLGKEFDWSPDPDPAEVMSPEETAADIETERYAQEMVS